MKNKSGKYLLKVNKHTWEKFRVKSRKDDKGISVNQRINFWLEYKDIQSLQRIKVIREKSDHIFILEIYDLKNYKEFKADCKNSKLSVFQAINIMITDYIDDGASCVVNGLIV